MLILKMTPSQHTSRALTSKEVVDQPAMQQEHSVIDQTDLEIDKVDVELVLG